ncbi:phosphoenolpyruvate synthase [Actinoplanes hulinensis]|uniref:Phosphoenolpyruvate synthase n=1 Tax=Actinoplanes hulinensis TaxID=1144547 RepID=A0ABS7B8B7_9ACTN|nr:phosphoenolpyruvate synthase [Actinoplanes hulinensis]
MVNRYIVTLQEIDRTATALAGGKGANLGELGRIGGLRVPAGFVVTTEAYDLIAPGIADRLDRLSAVAPEDRETIRVLSAELRHTVESIPLPPEIRLPLRADITYAVRSSATGEDSAAASFAGQHDTYLNVAAGAVPEHVRRCWASLFAERAVAYRLRNGIDHRTVRMAVVVQEMVAPRAAGIMFTADPVNGDRKVTSIDAAPGLGEALVSGQVNADVYRVRDGAVTARAIGAGFGGADGSGGADHREAGPPPVLSGDEALRLADLGRRIEAHFGGPQDIEWCLDADGFAIVQSRPITTLFPVPETTDDDNHVYVSVGHQQMMTEAIAPLGLSVWKLTSPGQMVDAGGRLFVDVTSRLASPAVGAALAEALTRSDPLIGDALRAVLDREGFLPPPPEEIPSTPGLDRPEPIETDPAIVADLIRLRRAELETLRRDIAGKSGPELIAFVIADIQGIRRTLFEPRNMQAIMAGMDATWWLNENLETWLGEKSAADTLSLSAPGNVTSEMGMALLDVADALRPYPEVVDLLSRAGDDGFLDRLPEPARAAMQGFLDEYGMRCVGEIDITRPRWSEHPLAIVPMILSNIRNAEPGAHARRVEQGLREAARKEREVLARLRELPDGEAKAAETKRMIDRVRTFIGYREYPKYHLVSRYYVYKMALLEEARRLVDAGVLVKVDDIYFVNLDELHDIVRTKHADARLVRDRRDAFRSYQALTPPRVLTSDGEIVTGVYRRDDLPPGALAGLAVSAGTVEGRARVLHDLADADLAPGDILVTPFTDPSWTPAFVTVSGLVTEVGGLMTHGAVIAREYGLPAVVGVENATTLIEDGQRIRVHGTAGYVEIL